MSSSPDVVLEAEDDADLQVWLEIRNELNPDDPLRLEQLLARRQAEPERRELLVLTDGVAVGAASVGRKDSPPDLAYGWVGVLPPHRRRGVGSTLFAAVSTRATERGCSTLELWAREDDPDGIAFLEKRGFREVMRECGLALDLHRVRTPAPRLPDGVSVAAVVVDESFGDGAYAVASRTWRDIPRETGVYEREAWLEVHVNEAPEGALVALSDGRVIGFAGLQRLATDHTYEHGLLAVIPEYRRRGVARALKLAQIAWVREHGGRRIVTWNAEENAAVRTLNLSLGYEPLSASIAFRGRIS